MKCGNYHFTSAKDAEIESLIKVYHYSGRMPASIRICFALRLDGGLFGDMGDVICAAVFSSPVNRNHNPDCVELTRLVRHPNYQDIILSQFLAMCIRYMKQNKDYPYALSYADYTEGHCGGIYQATNWLYVYESSDGQHLGYDTTDGKFIHRRSAYEIFGGSGVEHVLSKDSSLTPVYGKQKYLYMYPLRWKKKKALKDGHWEEKPYPKPDETKT